MIPVSCLPISPYLLPPHFGVHELGLFPDPNLPGNDKGQVLTSDDCFATGYAGPKHRAEVALGLVRHRRVVRVSATAEAGKIFTPQNLVLLNFAQVKLFSYLFKGFILDRRSTALEGLRYRQIGFGHVLSCGGFDNLAEQITHRRIDA